MRRRQFSGADFARAGVVPVYDCNQCGSLQTDMRGQPIKPEFFCCRHPQCNGTTFTKYGSKAEFQAIATLRLRVRAGELRDLTLQPRFDLHAPGDPMPVKIAAYVADAQAFAVATGEKLVFEIKSGADTALSIHKRKHFEAEYRIKLRMIDA